MEYFVQCKYPDGDVNGGMFTEQQIIDMFGFRDSTDCEYEVYDVTRFGDVEKLEHRQDSFREPLYHRFVSTRFGTQTVFSCFRQEHEKEENAMPEKKPANKEDWK